MVSCGYTAAFGLYPPIVLCVSRAPPKRRLWRSTFRTMLRERRKRRRLLPRGKTKRMTGAARATTKEHLRKTPARIAAGSVLAPGVDPDQGDVTATTVAPVHAHQGAADTTRECSHLAVLLVTFIIAFALLGVRGSPKTF